MKHDPQISNIIEKLIRNGTSCSEIQKQLNLSDKSTRFYRSRLNLPNARMIQILNNHPQFKEDFIKMYHDNSISEIIELLKIHPVFSVINRKFKERPNQLSYHKRIIQLRNFYKLSPKKFEHSYECEYDRIRGYIIRNTKFMAKRRGIYFDLSYTDFQLPVYCPLLNIKLTFFHETPGSDASHASLDRIDNSKGYIKGNVMVMSRLANVMKNAASLEQLETFSKNCLKLTEHYKNQGSFLEFSDVFENYTPKLGLDV